ncbi:hypothetical protein L3Q82_025552 [Scortum barcoo]|uniref:Uncharacterized protein n=1 Tax=Scortum barcoo TaxID=214431 RepID=A0ACB8WLR8_9TELE|nr:hypothetical protein L3Q82_025552 [Scortum barcoo]
MVFIDYSSAFNTIVPSKLVTKLRDLGLNSALCDWILNFLTGRPQAVRMGSTTSSTLTLNTGAPQGCVLSPLLYSLFTHDCVATTHSSNTIIKFADDTTVIGLITGDDESGLQRGGQRRSETLASWCQDNNLHLNVSKTKELIVGLQEEAERGTRPPPSPSTGLRWWRESTAASGSSGFTSAMEDLTWTHHTDFITKSARQRLFFLRSSSSSAAAAEAQHGLQGYSAASTGFDSITTLCCHGDITRSPWKHCGCILKHLDQ